MSSIKIRYNYVTGLFGLLEKVKIKDLLKTGLS